MTQANSSAGPPVREDDSGFTLIELLVAMMIITAVLLSLMAIQTSALVTTAQSRQRTQGTAIANQTMEELRALPWLTLNKGLHTSFASAAVDPDVSSGRLHPAGNPAINEPLVTSSTQATDKAPLSGPGGTNRTIDSDPSIAGLKFTTRTYVTRATGTDPDVLTLTVITGWSANKTGVAKSVIVRSEAYAPAGGCGDASNQPFLGACQALLTASAGATGATTTITAATAGPTAPATTSATPILPGSAYTVGTVVGGQAGVGVTSQQTTSVDASVLHAGSSLVTADPAGPEENRGLTKVSNAASNDVGASGAAPANPPDVSSSGSVTVLGLTSGNVALSLGASSGVAAAAKASMTASCAAGVPAGQGCGATTTSGGGATTVALTVDAGSFGLASIAAGGSTSSFGARFSSAPGTSTTGCTAISGAGCIAAGVSRSLSSAAFGTGAWVGGAAPNGLVTVTSYSDSVRVERGASQRTTAAVAARTAQLSVWTGTGYATQTVDRLTSQTVVSPAVSWTQGGSTVTATATTTVTPAMSIASNPDPALCGGEGCTIDADTGTITVAVTWTVTTATTSASFTSATILGGSRASAAYKAAPGA